MPSCALVFSSDQDTSHLLLQVLEELGIQVEHCPDIFEAIEKLTARSYQIIIADWVQEVEADFFLKTARELKFAGSTFSLAVIRDEQTAAALQTGVSGVLTKPITLEQARTILLTALNAVCPQAAAAPPAPNDAVEVASSPEAVTAPQETFETHNRAEHAYEPPYIALPPAKPFSFAGYAHQHPSTRRFNDVMRRVGLGVCFTAAVAMLVMAGDLGFRSGKLPSSHQISNFFSRLKLPQSTVSEPEDTSADLGPEKPSTSPAFPDLQYLAGSGSPAPSAGRIRVVPVPSYSHRATLRTATPVATAANSPLAPDSSQPVLQPVNATTPQVPESLFVPATTAYAANVSAPVPGSKWTEPLILPEEVSRSLLIRQVLPKYPEEALRAGLQGVVTLQAWIGRDGSVRDLKLIRGYLVLGQAAFQAVKQWQYRPYRVNGELVEMQTYVTVDFRSSPKQRPGVTQDGTDDANVRFER